MMPLSKVRSRLATFVLALTLAAPSLAFAQEPAHPVGKKLGPADIIMPHITDSKTIDLPCIHSWSEWVCEFTFDKHMVTVAGHTFDIGLTKHIFFEMLAAVFLVIFLTLSARSHVRNTKQVGRPKGFPAALEAIVLYLRNEIYVPVLGGHGGEKYVPFCLTLFFFILFCNFLGLIPYGSTATGNIAVTATLAIITFVMIEIAGMRKLGLGYIGTIIYWPHDMSLGMKMGLTVIMTPIELVGKFTKPFALTIRLFANMLAGHVIILALIGLIFMFGAALSIVVVPMALFIMGIEILVALIQAFIFSLLAAVFIGQIRSAHH